MDDIWLLPVSHVNSNNTAWHLETQKKKNPRLDRGGACGSDFQRRAPPDPLTNILFMRSLRASADLHAQAQHAPTGWGPSMWFINHLPSCGKSELCLPTISASFPAIGRKKKKKKREAKQAKVFPLRLAKRGVDMDEAELFVWKKEKKSLAKTFFTR